MISLFLHWSTRCVAWTRTTLRVGLALRTAAAVFRLRMLARAIVQN